MAVTGEPSTNTWPESGSSMRVISRSRLLLPAPLGPTTEVMVPRGKCRLTSCSTRFSARVAEAQVAQPHVALDHGVTGAGGR
jgi:hypothetical protein